MIAFLVDVRFVGDRDLEFDDHPVTAVIGERCELAVGDRMQGAPVMAHAQRADRDAFDRSLEAARLDVFADPERVVEQEEHAGHHVAHQRLRAETDRDADHARAGQQRPDVDPDRREGDHHPDHDQYRSMNLRSSGFSVRARALSVGLPAGWAARLRSSAVSASCQAT